MSLLYLAYRNDVNHSGGTCSAESELLTYLQAAIIKFNHRHGTRLGFYTTQELAGQVLLAAREVVTAELRELIQHYHVDADPTGFGRRGLRVTILGQELILNHFSCLLDRIIHGLGGLLKFLDRTIGAGGRVRVYGLAHLDTLDCHVLWEARRLAAEGACTVPELRRRVEYVFETDGLLAARPNIFFERLQQLAAHEYLTLDGARIQLSPKGQLVEVWTSHLTRQVAVVRAPGPQA
jgi:hypothetical protein